MAETAAQLICACPKCATRFRVTEEVLAVADGQVRCGACLSVFNGQEHQLAPLAPAALQDGPRPAMGTSPISPADAPPPVAEPRIADRTAIISATPHPARKRQPSSLSPALPIGCAVAAAILAAGVLGLRFDAWVQQPAARGVFETGCALVGCELPPLRSLAAIKADDIAINERFGPPAALILEVDLINEAPFRQRFPVIAVRLADADGKLATAEQRIEPANYLAENQSRTMTPDRPVHIALRIPDPGPEAVSCSLSLL